MESANQSFSDLDSTGDPRANITAEELVTLRLTYFWMQGVASTIISSVGVVSNALNIITIMRCRKRLKSQMYHIFLGMAFADFMHMVSLLVYDLTCGVLNKETIPKNGYPFPTVTLDMYRWMHSWYFGMCISNWCAVLLVLYRLYGIVFPLKASQGDMKVECFIVLVYVLSFVCHIPSWIIHELDAPELYQTFSTISATMSVPIPLMVCAASTAILLWNLRKTGKAISKSVSKKARERRKAHQRSITATLIVIAGVFIFTNTFLVLYFMFFTYGWFIKLNISHYVEHILYLICSLIAVSSYGSNFFVYLMGNEKFRDEFLCRKKTSSRNNSSSSGFRSLLRSQSCRHSRTSQDSGIRSGTDGQKLVGRAPTCKETRRENKIVDEALSAM